MACVGTALAATGQQRREFVKDALLFRARRHELFADDAASESQQLSNEGLAEYTGMKLGGKDSEQQKQIALNDLDAAAKKPSFVRSFAYGSGPAYGLLLDDAQPNWRATELTVYRPMEELLRDALRIELPKDIAAASEVSAAKYDGVALLASENEREKQRVARVASLRALLVDGPTLRIPLRQMQISFNPNNLQPLEGLGTAYPNLRISDVWGVLEVTKGALISPNWNQVTVAAPTKTNAPKLEGDGWTLELKEGWSLKPAERKGDFLLSSD